MVQGGDKETRHRDNDGSSHSVLRALEECKCTWDRRVRKKVAEGDAEGVVGVEGGRRSVVVGGVDGDEREREKEKVRDVDSTYRSWSTGCTD